MKLSALCKCYSTTHSPMSLRDWFCVSREGGRERGGLVHPEHENSMAMSGLAV